MNRLLKKHAKKLYTRLASGGLGKKLYHLYHSRQYSKHVIPEAELAAAEKSDAGKRTLIQKYEKLWPDYVRVARKELGERLGTERYAREGEDALFCCLAYQFLPEEYVCFRLWERTSEQRRAYMTTRYLILLYSRLNDRQDSVVFRDKADTYRLLGDCYGREVVKIASEQDFPVFERFIAGRREIIKKPADGALGRGVERITLAQYAGKERDLFHELIRDGAVLLEELLIQSPDMASFHPSSVNTLRCISFHTPEGVLVPFCLMRTGRGGSVMDNAGAGGIIFGIDTETGVANTDGFDEAGNSYSAHPDTGVTFKGFRVPDFEGAMALCAKAAMRVPKVRCIGWDLAHTEQGWVLIEGNDRCQMIGAQMTQQRGLRKEYEAMAERAGVRLK